jgi:hypothetical protein
MMAEVKFLGDHGIVFTFASSGIGKAGKKLLAIKGRLLRPAK